ncbi:D-alanyl-D-alanine carboxypeptidase [Actinoplanes sp. NPDC026619]|uniref:D-alanyl-D-alanine carboxypeptidase family protein n=1 Tax=Actinoplanes sp. NPDC026619 TaxID=3155798 RepID=UPI0033D94FA3
MKLPPSGPAPRTELMPRVAPEPRTELMPRVGPVQSVGQVPQAAGRASVGAPVQGPPPAAPGGPAVREPRRRKRLLLAVLLPVVLLLALGGGGVAAQLHRALPAAALTTDIAAGLKIPGALPNIPWPSKGSAELLIEGMGRLGGSGDNDAEPIGSVAKVMTAYLILKNHPLSGDEDGPTITVTSADVADYQARIPLGQSLVPVTAGERMTERDALEALMLPSANNVAHMLGVWDAGSQDAFLEKMNDAAEELGMTGTHYTDPSGYLPTTVSTAADQVALARAALKDEVFADIVALPSADIPVAGKIKNYNDLLGEQGVFGIKTGSTGEAGGNLVFAAHLSVGGKTLTVIGAVFNQPGAHTPEQLANVNAAVRKLLKSVRNIVKEYTLLADKTVGKVKTAWGSVVTVSPAIPLKVIGWPGLTIKVTTTTAAPGSGVTSGQVVGAVQASGVRVDLATDAATTEPTFWWKVKRRP